jgi:hypothetical protein
MDSLCFEKAILLPEGHRKFKIPRFAQPDLEITSRTKWHSHSQCNLLDLKEEHGGPLADLASVLPGKVSISLNLGPNSLPLMFRVNGVTGTKGVVFAWFPPWALEQFLAAQYIELGTSLRALKPDIYSAPLAITANESISLGLIVGLSESTELYHWFVS